MLVYSCFILVLKKKKCGVDFTLRNGIKGIINASYSNSLCHPWIASGVKRKCLKDLFYIWEPYSRHEWIWALYKIRRWVGVKECLDQNRMPSWHILALATEAMWSSCYFNKGQTSRVTPNIGIWIFDHKLPMSLNQR